jgi:hypothetical protein
MPFGILIVVDAHQQYVTRVIPDGTRIVPVPDLADGGIGVLVIFQFDDKCRLFNILSWY